MREQAEVMDNDSKGGLMLPFLLNRPCGSKKLDLYL